MLHCTSVGEPVPVAEAVKKLQGAKSGKTPKTDFQEQGFFKGASKPFLKELVKKVTGSPTLHCTQSHTDLNTNTTHTHKIHINYTYTAQFLISIPPLCIAVYVLCGGFLNG